MALTKTRQVIAASTSVAAGSSKGSPGVTSSTINTSTFYGGDIHWTITNGASAPGAGLQITFQVSATADGSSGWVDYYTVGGDNVAFSSFSNTIPFGMNVQYLRAIAYGNTTNAVTFSADISAVTGL
jgi:hypothetical protein